MSNRIVVLSVGLLVQACSLKTFTVAQSAKIFVDANVQFQRETDLQLAREALPATLKTLEGFLAADPDQRDLLALLAEGYVAYAFGVLEDDAESVESQDITQATQLRARAGACIFEPAILGCAFLNNATQILRKR